MSEKEGVLVKRNMMMNEILVSDVDRKVILGSVEDESDLASYKKALIDYCRNPKTYTLDEVEKEILDMI